MPRDHTPREVESVFGLFLPSSSRVSVDDGQGWEPLTHLTFSENGHLFALPRLQPFHFKPKPLLLEILGTVSSKLTAFRDHISGGSPQATPALPTTPAPGMNFQLHRVGWRGTWYPQAHDRTLFLITFYSTNLLLLPLLPSGGRAHHPPHHPALEP